MNIRARLRTMPHLVIKSLNYGRTKHIEGKYATSIIHVITGFSYYNARPKSAVSKLIRIPFHNTNAN